VDGPLTRRGFLAAVAGGLCTPAIGASAQTPFRFGLTPVFLDNDAIVIEEMRTTLRMAMRRPIELLQRRTYEEVTGLLLSGSIDAAWLCGYPFLQHRETLSLVAVPIWRDKPLYRSYLIAAPGDRARELAELEGGIHAFSDPNSNSGWLVTTSNLARINRTPDDFFDRTIFTYGHRNVVRAVASGLARSGSVDGYVWDVLAEVEPELAGRTRVVARSEWLGFPPIVSRADRIDDAANRSFMRTLYGLDGTDPGRAMLRILHLDGFAPAELALFDGIAARMREVSVTP